jgi:hypothetical protein
MYHCLSELRTGVYISSAFEIRHYGTTAETFIGAANYLSSDPNSFATRTAIYRTWAAEWKK